MAGGDLPRQSRRTRLPACAASAAGARPVGELPGRAAGPAAAGRATTSSGPTRTPGSSTTSATRHPATGSPCSTRSRPTSAPWPSSGTPGCRSSRRCAPLIDECGAPLQPFLDLDRGQPGRPAGARGTRRSTTCSATADSRPRRSGASCCTSPAPPTAQNVADSDAVCNGAAGARALPGRRRGRPSRARVPARRPICRREPSTLRADVDAASPRCAPRSRIQVDARARACCEPGRRAGAAAARLGAAGGRRIRRRRARHRRRAAPRGLRRARPAPSARRGCARRRAPLRLLGRAPMTPTSSTRPTRECERITREQARNFSWGIRLLPAPQAPRPVGGLRDGPAHRRHRRRRPARRARSCASWPAPARGATAPRRAPDDPVLRRARRRRAPLADPARRVRRTRRRLRDGRDRAQLRRPRRARRATAAASPGRSAGCRSACSTRRCRRRPGARGRAGRRARRRAAADEHPARHPRGPRQRPGLPAQARPRPVRRRAARPCPTARSTRRTARSPSSSGSRPRGPGAGTTAACSCCDVLDRRSAACCARDGRHLPRTARPHRRRPGASSCADAPRCRRATSCASPARSLAGGRRG